ncbi:N-6 DNA methylase [Pontibacter ummariensis]|uniref:site-specific DNA-methyltransferase (adenine-specific) n=1 Tax=Pontibacter ummariensis TaxID=1610492 RepID=A0A239JE11_9BACT|nr:type ISP restriction/modification enzyme [Pontibacter ummariensis]PRY08381.1 N-6 DNA methylase [Pontibacter ummariensis]SNT04060.1 N-6 DNA Methylase [Pontibacter ummariensis]
MQTNATAAYFAALQQRYKLGNATEHTYRGDLQQLIESINPEVQATNEPKRQACGAPDYIITRNDIPLGFIEAKDLHIDLSKTEKSDQMKRYLGSLQNLILTDYLEFRLFRDGQKVDTVRIAKLENGQLVAQTQEWERFENLLRDFCTHVSQTIRSAQKLASMMAGKARLMQNVLQQALEADVKATEAENQSIGYTSETGLYQQYLAFKEVLLHDITPADFADIYAQSIAYGMFAARLHDPTLPTFSRQEAASLIPQTNPFLRKLFQYIAGYDLDQRLAWIVDALADVFRATDVAAILKNFGKSTQTHDPIIHFYETFLSEYNPALRKSRGVWYTPEPVVNFIVRAVDDILKTEFNLKDGLASTETTEIEVATQLTDKRTKDNVKKAKQTVHRVQVLDPATGTGTFLAEVVKHVYQQFEGQEGIWSQYVEKNLLPRLNGFEILMASYAMCHLKLDLLLAETGYKPLNPRRFKVYLTNSLEEATTNQLNLFTQWLSNEAAEANAIKRETPVMVVLGNPPYSVSSSNKGEWIQNLIADYKVGLKERKINLDDDYIKFIRYAEHYIEKTGQGIVAMITNNSFIDGITHRQMRKHLLETFDKIYVLDLHGSAKKNEVAPDGSKDENVFDIQQGVSISLFVKTEGKPNKYADLYFAELFGNRNLKYRGLAENSVGSIKWNHLTLEEPSLFFVPKNFELLDEYRQGFGVTEILTKYNSGVQTKRDALTINFDLPSIEKKIADFKTFDVDALRKKYNLPDDGRDWRIEWAKNDVINNQPRTIKIFYRPFDNRYTMHSGKSKGFIAYPREPYTGYLNYNENISLVLCRQLSTFDFQHCFVSNIISDLNSVSLQTKEQSYQFPLYLYPENKEQTKLEGMEAERQPNLDAKLVAKFAKCINLRFVPEKEGEGRVCFADSPELRDDFKDTFAPLDLLDYIYAVLHAPSYRSKYKEFLKIDFPRIPYPTSAEQFWQLVALGGELRQLHLLEHPALKKLITRYPESGSNAVEKPRFEPAPDGDKGRVYISNSQYFDGVPKVAWEFYIGGYQPAQKWLKDRKGRELQIEDVMHYQRMIVALSKTAELMQTIDRVLLKESL